MAFLIDAHLPIGGAGLVSKKVDLRRASVSACGRRPVPVPVPAPAPVPRPCYPVYVWRTPTLKGRAWGAALAISMPSEIHLRVSAGSMMASTQSRAAA